VTVAAALVFLFFGAGTTYSLLAPDYVFAGRELPGEAAVIAGSLALAAQSRHRNGAARAATATSASTGLFTEGTWRPR
jgi:hypothetical protein